MAMMSMFLTYYFSLFQPEREGTSEGDYVSASCIILRLAIRAIGSAFLMQGTSNIEMRPLLLVYCLFQSEIHYQISYYLQTLKAAEQATHALANMQTRVEYEQEGISFTKMQLNLLQQSLLKNPSLLKSEADKQFNAKKRNVAETLKMFAAGRTPGIPPLRNENDEDDEDDDDYDGDNRIKGGGGGKKKKRKGSGWFSVRSFVSLLVILLLGAVLCYVGFVVVMGNEGKVDGREDSL